MKRLFISLYLLVSISIISIGWTLDNIWHKNVDENINLDAPLITLAHVLTKLPTSAREQYLSSLPNRLNIPVRLVDKNKVSLTHNQPLTDYEVFTVVNDGQQYQFINVGEQVLMSGPIDITIYGNQRHLYTLVFFLFIGLAALAWVWPLSRDLKKLQQHAVQLQQANWHTRTELSKSSQVQPLARAYNNMAQHIGALLENQRHLSNTISHEIRTPLARLKFSLALLSQANFQRSEYNLSKTYLAGMTQDIQEMESLLQELLTYASLETALHHQHQPLDLLRSAKQTVVKLQRHHKIPIRCRTLLNSAVILGENQLIERALQNLISNAQRFAKSRIDVFVKRTVIQGKSYYQLSVIDDGEGISAAEQAKVFDPFYRIQSQQNGSTGHGLGLAIVTRVAESHQGWVNVSSRPGHTQFVITLPQMKSS
ncbi:ATP-binding protein [Shewanella gelidii]|uniref:histidine kinase n=1 Tax=Shewanella gelidii TaxID=1642821 RepID=A0A917JIT4_9GAMM|nr:ATP-binding protein [Shewanella gelidii]MCL1096811.1 ATP-binding protein [Shewanella gelidii]GGI70343.1 two-component sensor histidine kinase [Shewanella gelidii]